MYDPTTSNVTPPATEPVISPPRRRRLSKREEIRTALRELTRVNWRSLWLATRNFSRAWMPLALGALLALSSARVPLALANGVTATVTNSELIVTGTANNDTITLTDEGGFVKVNGTDPQSGAFQSTNLHAITISGQNGADTISTTMPLPALFAANGFEFIVDGGAGPDTIMMAPKLATDRSYRLTVRGGSDDDTIDVSAVNLPTSSVMNGGDELMIDAGIGDDTVISSPTTPSDLNGNEGNDTLLLTADGELLFNSSSSLAVNGKQYVYNGFEQADLRGGAGADTIDARAADFPVTISGEGGNDRIFASSAGGALNGGEGDDSIWAGDSADTVTASPGADQIVGVSTASRDLLTLAADSNITLVSVPLTNGGAELTWGSNTTSISGSFANVQFTGGPSANTIDASGYSNRATLRGEGGNDTLTGGAGDNILDGGAGVDTVHASAGSDQIFSDGADTLRATNDGAMTLTDQSLVWNGGMTTFNGSFEEAFLVGGPSANTIDASGYSGRAILRGNGGNDTLAGGAGDDTLDGDDGNDVLGGGAGKDRYLASVGSDTVDSASSAEGDTLELSADSDMLLTPQVLSWAGNTTILNGSFAEVMLTGGAGANTIDALSYTAPVVVAGGAGNDTIRGGSGNDTIDGEDGDDTIRGGLGNDTIRGGLGNDTIDGAGEQPALGASLALAKSDDDALDGGAGIDTLLQTADADQTLSDTQATGSGTDSISNFESAELTGGAGANIINASPFRGSVTIRGLGGNDTLIGGTGGDTLDGGAGIDTLRGGAGNDLLLGQEGDDLLFGEDGDDTLTGGAGDDTLDGGPGIDTLDGEKEGGPGTPPVYKLFVPLVKR